TLFAKPLRTKIVFVAVRAGPKFLSVSSGCAPWAVPTPASPGTGRRVLASTNRVGRAKPDRLPSSRAVAGWVRPKQRRPKHGHRGSPRRSVGRSGAAGAYGPSQSVAESAAFLPGAPRTRRRGPVLGH